MYVFVYGSLKRGFPNHRLIERSKFICNTQTSECYAMLDLHDFPGVVKERKISNIKGEVYDLEDTAVKRLDEFEGNWYSRESVDLDAGFSADMYFLKCMPSNPAFNRIIEDGIWT